jgi:hypothetical protein
MLDRLQREPSTAAVEPLPNWFARRKQTVPAANDVVATLPSGPAVPRRDVAVPQEIAG